MYSQASSRTRVHVSDSMQPDYWYDLTAPAGKGFDPEFTPDLSPKEMLAMGVFGGKYMTDGQGEFPADWFVDAKLSPDKARAELNFYEVAASQSLQEWRRKGWIFEDDPRGWFQWYCRYYLGRRLEGEDQRQIKRWKAMRRHAGQVKASCAVGDVHCRPRQRQALLHWAYDSTKI